MPSRGEAAGSILARASASSLRAGDVVLVPHGEGHRLSDDPASPCISLWDTPRIAVSERYDLLSLDGGGERVDLICGAVRFEHMAAAHLMAVLPRVLRIESGPSAQGEWVQSTLRYMAIRGAPAPHRRRGGHHPPVGRAGHPGHPHLAGRIGRAGTRLDRRPAGRKDRPGADA